jgi:hypothetical protein
MAKTFYALMIVLCLFLGVLTFVASQQISFNLEYVSPPPAEISYLSLNAPYKVCTLCPSGNISTSQETVTTFTIAPVIETGEGELCGGCLTHFESRMEAYSLESGPYIASLSAFYPNGREEVCWSSRVHGPGRIDLSISCDLMEGYQSIKHSLFMWRGGGRIWIQSIDINGVGVYCLQGVGQPNIKDVSIEAHRDLGGILVHVFLNAPGISSNVGMKLYRGGQVVYDFDKIVNIPREWANSPCIDLCIDFGPLYLKESGTYIIRVDAVSDGVKSSKSIVYEKPEEPGWITASVDNPYGASWRIYWSGGASGSKTGVSSDSWSIWATSKVDFRAEVLSSPSGYTCSIYPSSITVQPGEHASFRVDCNPVLEKTVTYTMTSTIEKTVTETQMREYTRTVTYTYTNPVIETVTATIERTVATTVTAQPFETTLPMILSMVAIAIAVAVLVTSLIASRKRVGQQ